MKKIIISFMTIILLTIISYAGGKTVSAVETKVAPIPAINVHTPIYIGFGFIGSFIKRDPCPCKPNGKDIKDTEYGMIARIGFDYNQYLGLEGRYIKTFGTNVFSKVEHYGIYLKPQYHISDKTNVYALLGYGKNSIDYNNGILRCSVKKNSFSYGIGLEHSVSWNNNSFGIWGDFQHLLNNEKRYHSISNILSIGIIYKF